SHYVIISVMYVVITSFCTSYCALQLSFIEMFVHLPMFNKKYSIGLCLVVAIANIRSEFGIYDIIFGTLHTALSLLIVFLIIKESDSLIKKMLINTAVFTAMSFILALMVSILTNEMFFFWVNYASF